MLPTIDVLLPAYNGAAHITAMQQAEKEHGTEVPLMVFTDLLVVNEVLQPLHPSMWQLQRLDPRWTQNWRHCLVQNAVSGCTTLINPAAVAKLLPLPLEHGLLPFGTLSPS